MAESVRPRHLGPSGGKNYNGLFKVILQGNVLEGVLDVMVWYQKMFKKEILSRLYACFVVRVGAGAGAGNTVGVGAQDAQSKMYMGIGLNSL